MQTASEFLIGGLLLACAVGAGRAAAFLGLPRVAAYLLVGVAFSPELLGHRVGLETGAWSRTLATGALGAIAYLIGGSVTVGQLRRMGRVIAAGTLGESLGAMLLVFFCLWGLLWLRADAAALPLALAFGVLAISTAPAATLAVMHQYRAQGPLTNTLLGVVALDDAVGIICVSLLLVVVADHGLGTAVASAGFEIGGAILLGALAGAVLCWASRFFGESALRLPLVLSSILLVLGIADGLGLSLLLSAMALGFFGRRFARASAQRLFNPVYRLEEMIFILFFTIAGANFDVGLFQQHWDLIVTYTVARVVGKAVGATAGASLADAPPAIVRWLGPGLVPQAGVAVGLALVLSHHEAYAQTGRMIVNVILGTTLLYELVGPLAVRFALQRAGELRAKRERHRHAGF